MFVSAKPADAFTFSLGGVAAVNSHAIVPALANNQINRAWDQRLGQPADNPADNGEPRLEDQPETTIREIEDFLARYFAPGCGKAA